MIAEQIFTALTRQRPAPILQRRDNFDTRQASGKPCPCCGKELYRFELADGVCSPCEMSDGYVIQSTHDTHDMILEAYKTTNPTNK